MTEQVENHVVNISGGRTSGYLAHLMRVRELSDPGINVEYLYCDTGAEHPETYKFIRKMIDVWGLKVTCIRTVITNEFGVGPSYRLVDFSECKPDLIPFLDVCKKHGTPTVAAPLCSDRMKGIPADKYCNDKYGKGNYYRWLGMRIDEQSRIKTTQQQADLFDKTPSIRNRKRIEMTRYLADISAFEKSDVLHWWEGQSFNLDLEEHLGNCVFCIKKGANKLALAAMDEPDMADRFIEMVNSESVHNRPSRGVPPDIMYRGNKSLEAIISDYSGLDREEVRMTMRMSKRFESGCCSESCEAMSSDPDLFSI